MLRSRFCSYYGIFWWVFYAPLTRPFIDTLNFWWIKVHIWWYISRLNFIYVWFVVPKFSNFKRIRSSRKVDFRQLLGGFLTILPPTAVKFFWDFDQSYNAQWCIRYVTVFIVLSRNSRNWAKKLNFWFIFRYFSFTPSYTLWVTSQFFTKWELSWRYKTVVSLLSIAFVVVKF